MNIYRRCLHNTARELNSNDNLKRNLFGRGAQHHIGSEEDRFHQRHHYYPEEAATFQHD